jgi:hypothetical protein
VVGDSRHVRLIGAYSPPAETELFRIGFKLK